MTQLSERVKQRTKKTAYEESFRDCPMFVGNSGPMSELSGFSIWGGGEEALSLAIFTEASRWSELFVASLQ